MRWPPRIYQPPCVRFLIQNQHGGLLLDMGLGKTSIALKAIALLLANGDINKILLVAPIRTLYTTWPDEIDKWDDFNGITYHNLHKDRIDPSKDSMGGKHIYGINPEGFLTMMRKGHIFHKHFDLFLLDESSTFKNPASLRFKALKPQLHNFKRRWILTGTPAPNGLEDIWSQIYVLDRGEALGQYITHFRNKFCMPNWSGYGYTVMPQAREQIFEAIAPLVIRLDAADHLEMPDLVINQVPVKLPPKAMKAYKEMEKQFFTIIESEPIASPNAAVAGMRCRQMANGGIYMPDGSIGHLHSAKAAALKEIVENLQGNPLLVFYEFRHDVERIVDTLGDIPNLTASKEPDKLIRQFNEGTVPVMMGHPSTIGMGLNLQAKCHHIAWVGVPWDLGLMLQANARVWRQGQEADRVFIHFLMAEDTLDATVLAALGLKDATQKQLFDAIKRLSPLSDYEDEDDSVITSSGK